MTIGFFFIFVPFLLIFPLPYHPLVVKEWPLPYHPKNRPPLRGEKLTPLLRCGCSPMCGNDSKKARKLCVSYYIGNGRPPAPRCPPMSLFTGSHCYVSGGKENFRSHEWIDIICVAKTDSVSHNPKAFLAHRTNRLRRRRCDFILSLQWRELGKEELSFCLIDIFDGHLWVKPALLYIIKKQTWLKSENGDNYGANSRLEIRRMNGARFATGDE